MVLTALIALPLGVGAAVYLEEYGKQSRLARLIEINIANLAGVPSIVYGLLGPGLFVRTLRHGPQLDRRACTLALLVLPMVVLVCARGVAHRAAVAARGCIRARCDALADHPAGRCCPWRCRHLDRRHPGAVARDRRNGAAGRRSAR